MAHFYGTVAGGRGEAHRVGHKNGAVHTEAAGWGGAVRVTVYFDDATQQDWALVRLGQWHGRGQSPEVVLYNGPLDHYLD